MSVNKWLRPQATVARLVLAGAAAGMIAGCSSELERFASGPFGSADATPVGTVLVPPSSIAQGGLQRSVAAGAQDTFNTGAHAGAAAGTAPMSVVHASPLSEPASNPALAAPSTPNPRRETQSPPTRPDQAVRTAAPAPGPAAAPRAVGRHGPWNGAGGTPIVVASGETLGVLSRRYGVPEDAMLAVNGLRSASQISPGDRLVVPVYDRGSPAGARTAGASPARSGAEIPPTRPVASSSTAVAAPKPPARTVAAAPAATTPAASAAAAPAPRPVSRPRSLERNAGAPPARSESAPSDERRTAANAAPNARAERQPAREPSARQTAAVRQSEQPRQAAAPSRPSGAEVNNASLNTGNDASLRWPVRGRILQNFRKGQNDGINIAVPEGAPIRAAEGGVVAYAGDELRGYGNLVLIRHSNGLVTAYAHNRELNVRRGDTVTRGQVIARAGRTGNVSTPQLLFEVRKGAEPVNPMDHLAGQ